MTGLKVDFDAVGARVATADVAKACSEEIRAVLAEIVDLKRGTSG